MVASRFVACGMESLDASGGFLMVTRRGFLGTLPYLIRSASGPGCPWRFVIKSLHTCALAHTYFALLPGTRRTVVFCFDHLGQLSRQVPKVDCHRSDWTDTPRRLYGTNIGHAREMKNRCGLAYDTDSS